MCSFHRHHNSAAHEERYPPMATPVPPCLRISWCRTTRVLWLRSPLRYRSTSFSWIYLKSELVDVPSLSSLSSFLHTFEMENQRHFAPFLDAFSFFTAHAKASSTSPLFICQYYTHSTVKKHEASTTECYHMGGCHNKVWEIVYHHPSR